MLFSVTARAADSPIRAYPATGSPSSRFGGSTQNSRSTPRVARATASASPWSTATTSTSSRIPASSRAGSRISTLGRTPACTSSCTTRLPTCPSGVVTAIVVSCVSYAISAP
ncbi:hypothetical protein NCAST_32_09700 [Nocardia asteroides NBRC 15531]|uniref:Uncharacterized protein n=1 Tax=Nocardia asteroides NBRC 15531 TaxID=1110697 RepID=U5EN14_NOCAS|nr:hypothetical protein [Nocardia asteroides]UGT51733.1 hypothetical protein LT345_14775 [Nocardia asteroides]GAD86484.1 hypothetical protein NCAST_32_09700 [Nocardia asteroides NBRC 15531]